jgi:lipopolysaccharide export system permease protein
MSADKLFLVLTLYNGESFENLQTKERVTLSKETVPYRREVFGSKEVLIEYDANFARTDETFFQNQYIGKNLNNLQASIDSMGVKLDSIREVNATSFYASSYRKTFPEGGSRGVALSTMEKSGEEAPPVKEIVMNYDSLYRAQSPENKASLLSRSKSAVEYLKSDNLLKAAIVGDEARKLRRLLTEWHNKFTIPFACLVFFFIGAPLGAIIRKGGLGTPVVISVVLFIFYYVVNNIGFKMARDGVWEAWQGMWLSSAVLAPLGVFLTYKAVNDSVILNADTYLNALKNLIGKRASRKVERKEVIIYAPDYAGLVLRLRDLTEACRVYLSTHRRWINYMDFWKEGGKDSAAERLVLQMERVVEELGNSDRNLVLNKLMDYPVVEGYKPLGGHLNRKLGLVTGLFLPFGLPVYLIAMYRRKLLRQDIQTMGKVSEELKEMIV